MAIQLWLYSYGYIVVARQFWLPTGTHSPMAHAYELISKYTVMAI